MMRRIHRARASMAAVIALAASSPAASSDAASFTVSVTGLRSTSGNLVVCVWQERQGFPDCAKSRTAARRTVPVTGRAMRVSLPLPVNPNAVVTVHHDEDADGKLKANFIGMPKEGVGISNNRGGIPSYNRAVLQITAGSMVAISIRYL